MQYWEISSPRPGKEGKTHWVRVGTLFESKDGTGFNLVLDALPLPDKEGRVSLIARPPRPKDGQQTSGAQKGPSNDLNDAIPW